MRLSAFLAAAVLLLFAARPAHAHPSRAISVAPDGSVYFTDLERLWVIGPNGRLRMLREARNVHTHEIVIDRAGTLIGEDSQYEPSTGTYRQAIWRISPDGRFRYLYGPTTRAERGIGIVRDPRGCSYHANESMEGHRPLVHRRCPDGRVKRLFGSAADDRAFKQVLLSNVAGAALDPAGNFYFRQGDAVRRISRDGVVRTIATGLARENLGIAVDRDGIVVVAEAVARRVVRIDLHGRRSIAATTSAPWSPTGVTIARGLLYLLEASDYRRGVPTRMRVRRIATDGRSQTLASVSIPVP